MSNRINSNIRRYEAMIALERTLSELDEQLGRARELGVHDIIGLPQILRTSELKSVANYRIAIGKMLDVYLETAKKVQEAQVAKAQEGTVDAEKAARQAEVADLMGEIRGTIGRLDAIMGEGDDNGDGNDTQLAS